MTAHTTTDDVLIHRSFKARMFHAVLFELIAILLTTLFFVLVIGKDMFSMGVLSVIISLIATAWNSVFNYLFDHLQKRFGFSRSKYIRILHALGFEGGLVLFTVPIAAYYLETGFIKAFFLEAGLLLFFLPYSVIYNYIYDKIYIWFIQRKKH